MWVGFAWFIDHQVVRQHSIRTPDNWPLVFKMATLNGVKMIINEVRVVVLVHVAAIAVVHRHRIHQAEARMVVVVEELTILMDQVWERYHPVRPASSIRLQVRAISCEFFSLILLELFDCFPKGGVRCPFDESSWSFCGSETITKRNESKWIGVYAIRQNDHVIVIWVDGTRRLTDA